MKFHNNVQLTLVNLVLNRSPLPQTYHEEMLQRSPRRKLFNDYAKQLMRRYPSRKDEVTSRLSHLNKLWAELEAAITPLQRPGDTQTMLNGENC